MFSCLCNPLGIWSPGYRRSTSLGNAQHQKTSTRLLDDQFGAKSNGSSSRSKGASINNADSSSEISDEGYRTGVGVGDLKSEELDERPDSSCTQVSQSSSLESGVSSAGPLDDSDPSTNNYKQEKLESKCNYSKIPLLGSLRAMGRGASHYSTESNDSSRKSSIDSDCRMPVNGSSNASPNLTNGGFRRDTFGRHSLRTRSTSNDCEKLSVRPIIDSPTDQMTGSKNTFTWSGRNRRPRPAIQTESTFRNRTPLTTPGSNYRSRSVNSGASRGQSRASSTSPSSRRRNLLVTSMYSSGPSSPEIKPVLHLKMPKTYNAKQPTSPQAESPKISPLLRNMLKDVELDNDASILKKMEEIVNQYKARVESILAAEGKTLNDDFTSAKVDLAPPSNKMNGHQNNEDGLRKMKQGSTKLSRRNSLDSSLSHMPTRMFLSPRKEIASQSPSKIPMPRFYRPKETCF